LLAWEHRGVYYVSEAVISKIPLSPPLPKGENEEIAASALGRTRNDTKFLSFRNRSGRRSAVAEIQVEEGRAAQYDMPPQVTPLDAECPQHDIDGVVETVEKPWFSDKCHPPATIANRF